MSTQQLEKLEAEFREDTGYLSPFKDASAADNKNHDQELRDLLWKAYIKGRGRGIETLLQIKREFKDWRNGLGESGRKRILDTLIQLIQK